MPSPGPQKPGPDCAEIFRCWMAPHRNASQRGSGALVGDNGLAPQRLGKYKQDAAVLERALLAEKDPYLVARYTFYLAQSYRDCGEKHKAHQAYLHRAELGFWQEEIFISLLAAGKLMAELGYPFSDVFSMFEPCYRVPADARRSLARGGEALS